jgi:hypothetical protein
MSPTMQRGRNTLELFGQHCIQLAQLLKEGARFTPEQHLFIENNILAVQLALAASKMISSRRPPSARDE